MIRILFVLIAAVAVSGCCTFCNRGDVFSQNDHVANAGKMIAAAESVSWKGVK